jgi:hypothetical protein
MPKEMQYLRAPQENLQTWDGVKKLFVYSGIGCAVVLALLDILLVWL